MRIVTASNTSIKISTQGGSHTHFNKQYLDAYNPSLFAPANHTHYDYEIMEHLHDDYAPVNHTHNEYEPAGAVLAHTNVFNHNNIGRIKDVPVDDTNKADNRIIVYKASSQSFVYEDKPIGGGGTAAVWGNITGTLSNQTDLQNALNSKSNINHNHNDLYYTEIEVDNLLNNKANINHNHNDLYYTEVEINNLLNNKSDINHNHNDLYYTEAEIDSLLNNKSNINHNHNDLYYTETEIDNFLNNKSNINHTHSEYAFINHNHNGIYEPAGTMNNHITTFNHNNIGRIKDVPVDDTNKANDRILVYKSASQSFVYEDKPSGGGGEGSPIEIYDNGTRTTAFNINHSNGGYQKVTLGANIAMGISNPSDTSKAYVLVLFIHQDATGNRQWTGVNNTNVDLGGAETTFILSTTANFFDTFTFVWYSGKWRLVNAIFERS